MLSFYCITCGVKLAVDEAVSADRVRCGNCGSVVRTPPQPAEDGIPFARVLAEEVAEPVPMVALNYVPAWPERQAKNAMLEVFAERLRNVQGDDGSNDATGMDSCSYCGSTVAKFLRKCPFCRHALWGV
jgi:hypothetical protein